MKKFDTTIILFLTLISLSFAQLKFIPLSVDYAAFQGNDNKTYVEIYVAFFQSDLTYTQENELQTAHFSHAIKISKSDSLIKTENRNYSSTITEENQRNISNQFIDVFAYSLQPGKYTLTTSVFDETSNKNGEIVQDITVPVFDSNLNCSNVQFSNKIEKSATKTNFSSKNNLTIYPNPSATFGMFHPIMYFYFEAYNLKTGLNDQSSYSYHYFISDLDGKLIRDFPAKEKTGTGKIIAEANGLNVISLPGNNYFLNIEFKDLLNGNSAFTRKKFTVNKPDRGSSKEDIAARIGGYEEYANYSRNQLDDEFNQARYIASPEEKQVFEQLDAEAMKRFLANFWKRRDFTPDTPVNEYKQQYFENIQYANATYTNNFREGWRSDQGRVILIYGRPDEIERNPMTINTQPYDVWYYYSLEGGAQFIFGDITGHGNYELLHSNYRGEIKDPEWLRRIQKVRTSESNPSFENY